jgi:hypothetical protein
LVHFMEPIHFIALCNWHSAKFREYGVDWASKHGNICSNGCIELLSIFIKFRWNRRYRYWVWSEFWWKLWVMLIFYWDWDQRDASDITIYFFFVEDLDLRNR